jgi:hypothetical protein
MSKKDPAAEKTAAAIEAVTAAGVAAAMAPPGAATLVAAAAGAVAPAVARTIADIFGRYGDRNTDAIREAYEAKRRDILAEAQRIIPEVLARLDAVEPRLERLEGRVEERVEDPEFHSVLDNVVLEASREAIDERRRMLAHAFAGAFNVEMTIPEAARAERTLRELDPSDLATLRGVGRMAGRDFEREGPLRDALAVLLGAGCVHERSGWGGGVMYSITRTGNLVLRLLATYVPPSA